MLMEFYHGMFHIVSLTSKSHEIDKIIYTLYTPYQRLETMKFQEHFES